MSINAGTIAAYLTLDTSKFTSAMSSAWSQLKTLSDEGATFSDKMTAVGGACTTVGNSLTKNVTVPVLSLCTAVGSLAVSYEDAFAGVRKTVDASEEEYDRLSDSIMRMASEMPTAAEKIAAVMEAAGQLGIQKENLEGFTEVMVQLGDTTNLSADTAATTLARFANITGMSQENFDRLGSTIVDLGNNFATTEAEISDMALRIAGAGKQVGMTESDIMGVAAALSSVGLESEAGGTAISKVLTDMSLAVEQGVSSSNEDLQNFAKVAGMSSKEFVAAFKDDAVGALSAFISGLGSLEKSGGSAISVLDEMGITEVRMRDALLRSSGAANTFTSALQTASDAWEENTALTTEAEKRYGTTASQIKILWNEIKALGVQFGEELIPYLKDGIEVVSDAVGWFSDLNDGTKNTVVTAALLAASIGPVVTGVGRLISFVGTAKTAITAFNTACMANPYVLLATAIVGVTVALGSFIYKSATADDGAKRLGDTMNRVMEAAADFSSGISTANSILNEVDENLYTSESQRSIEENIESVQSKITAITELASAERRELTKKEIRLLEDYYKELNSLTEQQYAVYESKLGVLSTLIEEETSMTTERAQSYLKDAEALRDESKALAESSYAETLALLKQQYTTEEQWNSEYCQKQIQAARDLRDERIRIADEQYSGVLSSISNVFSDQNMGDVLQKIEQFYFDIDEAQKSGEAQLEANSQELNNMIFGMFGENVLVDVERWLRAGDIKSSTKALVSDIKSEFADGFSEIELSQIGAFLHMVANTAVYGGELSAETQLTFDALIGIFSYLPDDARESMKDTWLGMKEELAAGSPELYAAAEANADSIINAIDTALGIESPSKVMRERGRYTIQGFKNGMSDEKSSVVSDMKSLMDSLKSAAAETKLESVGSNLISGLQVGMNAKKPSLLKTATSIANSVSSKIRAAFDIHSPSRVMATIGSNVSAGLAKGMEDDAYIVRDAAENLATITSTTVRSSAQQQNIVSGAVSVSSKTNNTENKLDRVINLLEQLLLKDGDIIMDGRVFGRWARETIS